MCFTHLRLNCEQIIKKLKRLKLIMQTNSNHAWSDQKDWITNWFKYHEDKKTTEYNMNNSSNKIIQARDYFFILIREQKVSFTYMK